MSQRSFKVAYQVTPPAPSWTAYKTRSTGVLTVFADHADFQPKSGAPVVIDHVRKVTKGWKDSVYGTPMLPIVDTWVEVVYRKESGQSVAFFNDPRWLWLGSYLSHRKLVRSLNGLILDA